jgi:hypothetical protein
MPVPDILQPLVEDPAQACVQAGDHRHRCRVVVGAATGSGRLPDVAAEQPQVEVPRLRLLHPALERPVADRERGQPGCHTEALLGPGVTDVDTPVVGAQLDPADRGDRVGDQQRVALDRAQRGDVGADAGGGLGVHRTDHGRARVRVGHPLCVDRGAPLVLDGHHLCAAPGGDVTHPLPEQAVHRDHRDVTGADRVHERGLHPGRAGGTQRQRAGVPGAPHPAQVLAGGVHDLQERRVEVAQQRQRERSGRLGVGVRGAGAEQVPFEHAGCG